MASTIPITKICPKCSFNKESSLFYSDKSKNDGLSSYCRECRKSHSKQYNLTHKEEKIEYFKNYYQENKDILKPSFRQYYNDHKEHLNEVNKQWRDSNREYNRSYKRQYDKERKQKDPLFKIKQNLRNRLYYALKSKKWNKNTHFSEYIGCKQEILISHLEKQFKSGMSWENYGKIWQIDHIKNLASAVTENELYILSHYTNLQPLFIEEHREKTKREMTK
jgi:hypothetical protein